MPLIVHLCLTILYRFILSVSKGPQTGRVRIRVSISIGRKEMLLHTLFNSVRTFGRIKEKKTTPDNSPLVAVIVVVFVVQLAVFGVCIPEISKNEFHSLWT
jgi:hypothetical protein